jgi:hypothetical protein
MVWYGMKRRMEGVSRSWIKEGLSEVLFCFGNAATTFYFIFQIIIFFLLSNLFIITIIYFLYQNKNKI